MPGSGEHGETVDDGTGGRLVRLTREALVALLSLTLEKTFCTDANPKPVRVLSVCDRRRDLGDRALVSVCVYLRMAPLRLRGRADESLAFACDFVP
jgi:hypothetical protein